MQQINSDSLPPAYGGDRKITSDSFAESDIPHSTVVELPADFPPESFWLSKDAEFDWFDQNAFFQRNESTKGISNSMNLNPNVNTNHSNSSSNRYSVKVKSKAAIIGLPKPQKTTFVDSKRRQCNVRLFPKRLDSIGRVSTTTTVLVTEPSSPKVSCIGRVRSKRCRSRRKSSEFGSQSLKSTSQRSGNGTSRKQKQKGGLMSRLTSLFRSDGNRRRKNGKVTEKVEKSGSRKICVTVKPVYSEPATPSEPLGLEGMVRFASGRRLESWDVEDVAGCHSLDFARRV